MLKVVDADAVFEAYIIEDWSAVEVKVKAEGNVIFS
jgi:hypothetical protein